ncbi:hypothetical protein ACFX15_037984 [Malus domestica]
MSLYSGSYNYLGFAASDEHCTPRGIQSSEKFSVSTCSSRVNGGNARGSGAEVEHFERNCKFYTTLIASAIESEALFTYLALYILIVLAPWRLEKILREQIAYVYWDEALSIGAVRKMGRDVFFASHFLALASFSPSPPAAQQIISSMKVIFGEDGTSRGAQNSDEFAKTTDFFKIHSNLITLSTIGLLVGAFKP